MKSLCYGILVGEQEYCWEVFDCQLEEQQVIVLIVCQSVSRNSFGRFWDISRSNRKSLCYSILVIVVEYYREVFGCQPEAQLSYCDDQLEDVGILLRCFGILAWEQEVIELLVFQSEEQEYCWEVCEVSVRNRKYCVRYISRRNRNTVGMYLICYLEEQQVIVLIVCQSVSRNSFGRFLIVSWRNNKSQC